jgi:hypothetical protein
MRKRKKKKEQIEFFLFFVWRIKKKKIKTCFYFLGRTWIEEEIHSAVHHLQSKGFSKIFPSHVVQIGCVDPTINYCKAQN